MVDVVYYQKDLKCFDIQILYCYINLRSSIPAGTRRPGPPGDLQGTLRGPTKELMI